MSTGISVAGTGDAQIVFDPGTPGRIYARVGAQLLRSDDSGDTWQPLSLIHDAAAFSISVAANGSLFAAASDYGIQRSDDQGATWLALNSGLPGGPTLELTALTRDHFTLFGRVQNSSVPFAYRRGGSSNLWLEERVGGQELGPIGASAGLSNRVLAGVGQSTQLVVSDDAGANWQTLTPTVLQGVIDSFVFSPASDADIYAVGNLVPLILLGAVPGTLAQTQNGGITWVSGESPVNTPDFGALAIDPSNPRIVYAGAGSRVNYGGTRPLLRSLNGGASWSALAVPAQGDSWITSILVNPGNSNELVVAFGLNHSIVESTDGGQSWTSIGDGIPGSAGATALAADWTQTPPLLYAGTPAGIYSARLTED